MIIYRASAEWDDGQICSNGHAYFGLFARLEGAKAACEADGALPTWAPSPFPWRGINTLESKGSDGWKTYSIVEVQVVE